METQIIKIIQGFGGELVWGNRNLDSPLQKDTTSFLLCRLLWTQEKKFSFLADVCVLLCLFTEKFILEDFFFILKKEIDHVL